LYKVEVTLKIYNSNNENTIKYRMKIIVFRSIVICLLLFKFNLTLIYACSCSYPETIWTYIDTYDLLVFATVIEQRGETCVSDKYCQPEFTVMKVDRILNGTIKCDTLLYRNGWGATCGNSLKSFKPGNQLYLKLMYEIDMNGNKSQKIVSNEMCDYNVLKKTNTHIQARNENVFRRIINKIFNIHKKVSKFEFYESIEKEKYVNYYMATNQFGKKLKSVLKENR